MVVKSMLEVELFPWEKLDYVEKIKSSFGFRNLEFYFFLKTILIGTPVKLKTFRS
jgi:hypothetical protein